jgi:predicted GNAT superfamily acetyltransferase
MADVTIRALTDVESLRRIETLQMEIWGMPARDIVPLHQLRAAVGAGGAVLGAFEPDGSLVGFCYGFAGWRHGRPLFYSHMAGVTGGRRLRDIGFLLKRAQRDAALAMGYDRAVWTFDPLQSVNARFNLHKLGATARRYYVNYYGEMPDDLNRDLDSDRIEVDWALRSPRVEAAAAGQPQERDWGASPRALSAVPWTDLVGPADPVLDVGAPAIRLEIPTDFLTLRTRDPGLARAWRVATREVFLHYFGRDYRAVDFTLTEGETLRGDYILARDIDED